MRTVFIGAAVLFAAGALYGQLPATYNGELFQFQLAGGSNGETQMFGVASIGSQIVTGKPFSATEERHSLQLLGDGTHIESNETNRLFRDEQGRTRIERSGGAVTIVDPVAGFTAELHPAERTYSKGALIVRERRVVGRGATIAPTGVNPDQAKSDLLKLREELSAQQLRYTEKSPRIVQLEAQIADLEKASAAQSNIDELKALTASYQAEYAAKAGAPEGPAVTKEVQFRTASGPAAVVLRVGTGDNGSVESLPAQMVNGAMADGTRTTETIPVGKIGNDRAISIVNERWFSSDLQMLVKSTSSDPRFGDTTYQLMNITQTSPDPSLFQIPADYAPRK